jgi:hypothetical protein
MEPLPSWKTFLLELLLYSILVVAYFAFKELFDHDRELFAVMALVIMIGQTVGLEIVKTLLIWLLRGKKK